MSGFVNITADDTDRTIQYESLDPWKRIQTSNPKVRNGTLTGIFQPGFFQWSFIGTHTTPVLDILQIY